MINTFPAPNPDNLIVEPDDYCLIVYFTDEGTISAPEVGSTTYNCDDPDEVRQALYEGGRELVRRYRAGTLRPDNSLPGGRGRGR